MKNRPTLRSTLMLLAFGLCAFQAHANDSMARIGTHGLELVKSDRVRMATERLDISTQRIQVRYQFINESTVDVPAVVAFPLPRYGWNPGAAMIDGNEYPLRPFEVKVDGQSVPSRMSRRALLEGRDVTVALRRAGLKDAEVFDTFGCRGSECEFSPRVAAALKRMKALSIDGYPTWEVEEAAYWDIRFPAGRSLKVEHDYAPKVGMVYSVPYWDGQWNEQMLPSPARRKDGERGDPACLADSARAEVEQRVRREVAAGAKGVQVVLRDVEYVLGTGRNWKGPIGDFTLRVQKEAVDDIVALCLPGKLLQLDAKTLEFHASDFTPPDRLVLHFYRVEPSR
ncbi:DUF4424 family protein [Roseateles sp. L2-2]